MTIDLQRIYTDENSPYTISSVKIDGSPYIVENIPVFAIEPFDYFHNIPLKPTLKDIKNAKKVHLKETGMAIAIPEGTYNIGYDYSPKFNRELPILHNVPGFEGIRIHPFNSGFQSQGCISFGFLNIRSLDLSTKCCYYITQAIEKDIKAGNTPVIKIHW